MRRFRAGSRSPWSDRLYANRDVQGQLEQALPPRAQPLAGPAAVGLKELAVSGAEELLGRPRPQALWEEANRRAHGRFMDLIEGGGESVSTEGGDVTLDLNALLGQTAERFGVGGRAEAQIPDDAAQITILHADELELAQDAVRLLRALALVLVIMALGLFALAVYVARGWRREALRACGIGFLFVGAAALVARSLAGDAVVDALATTEAAPARRRGGLVDLHLAAGRGRCRSDRLRRGHRRRRLACRSHPLGSGGPAPPRPLPARAALCLRSAGGHRPGPSCLGTDPRDSSRDPGAGTGRPARARA